LVKHAVEQQKYQQSLSPKDKAQMLSYKADAEQKQCKCLTSDDLVRILKIDAAAHKKQ
jgi:hypothetical protein